MFDFSGKLLWITGANGGIARATAQVFYDLGATCILTDIEADGVASLALQMDPSGKRCVGLAHDVGKPEDAAKIVTYIQDRFDGLDYLVTGAGIYREERIDALSDEQWRQTMAANLDGVFYTCRAAIPLLIDGGAVVNISSMSGHKGSFRHGHYAASKGAVLAFTRSLALELAPRIRVNAISPGLIDTAMVQPLLSNHGEQLLAQTPLKRLGSATEVGQAVAFLCSPWSSFITAETIHVNGGLYISG